MTTTSSLMSDRRKFVTGLKDYLDNCQREVTSILQTLNWSPEHFLQSEPRSKCRHNENHAMPAQALEKHEQLCPFMSSGYSKQEAEEMVQSNEFYYENATHVGHVAMDKDVLNKVLWDYHVKNQSIFYGQTELPATRDEEPCQLSPQERSAVHSFVIDKVREDKQILQQEVDDFLTTNLQNIVMENISKEDKNAPKSYLEYIQAQRDYKRRRQSYRAKNVHITKKSYTEIIREVIENQTELFASFVRQEEEEDSDTAPQGDKERSVGKVESQVKDKLPDRDRSEDQERDSSDASAYRARSKERSRDRSKDYRRDRSKERYRERSESYYGKSERGRSVNSDYNSDIEPSGSKRHKKRSKKHKHKHHKHKSS